MRSYGQYCSLARALDEIGERWTLLIVRELVIRPCRFGELRDGLPGIASNLLTDRLRILQERGIVAHEDGRYRLTERGEALAPVLRELARWAMPLMVTGQGGDEARARWTVPAIRALLADVPAGPAARVRLEAEGEVVALAIGTDGAVDTWLGDPGAADLVLRGSMQQVMEALVGAGDEAQVSGDRRVLERLRRGAPALA